MATTSAPFVCRSCSRALRKSLPRVSIRALATDASQRRSTYTPDAIEHSQDVPRWQRTPPAMQMPIRLRPRPKQSPWRVNEDPELLDEMYDRFVGRAGEAAKGQAGVESTRGRDLLPEEVKVCPALQQYR